jgi:hypothetical protein
MPLQVLGEILDFHAIGDWVCNRACGMERHTKKAKRPSAVSGKAESPLTWQWGRRDEKIAGGGGYLKRPA